ncbi:MAG: TaqI-like C-terminal specificity domain-containing protein [Fluviicola sp.]|nr:TaqI-like C-terminal specificity domain-containing protein [Fluviicola sp.]
MVALNPEYDKLLLFKKTQKLLDRFLFIFFAEDRLLLPTNLIRRINLEWKNLRDARVQVSLYDRYKMYFEDLNTGAMVTLPAFGKKTGDAITAEFEIFAYNGGLFLPDEVLDAVKIDDALLYDHSHKMSDYNFLSEVDVNILGHIFENSLNEIDEIKSEIEGQEIDKTKTRRKKDGVFYTPKYITKYIVDNTIGKLCEEKKTEFQIIDEEFAKGRKNRNKTTIEKLDNALHAYRDWLLQITICDPACGSGAFLNQALEFLIQEHHYIDSLESQLLGYSFEFPGTEMHILENNIYGVDLNDESVEIAKLSLWLRTAQKGRKLNSLNNNIKCGNSLIDDVAVAGEKAFSWEKEFPEVFEKGGFDVVIGNPPYVRNELISNVIKLELEKKFKTYTGKSDLYVYFFERSHSILKENGLNGFIVSSKYTKTKYGKVLIDFLNSEVNIISYIDFKDLDVFEGIIAYPSIIIFRKTKIEPKKMFSNLLVVSNENYSEVSNQFRSAIRVFQIELFEKLGSWSNGSNNEGVFNLFKKLIKRNKRLIEIIEKPQVGIKTGLNSVYIHSKNNLPQLLATSKITNDYVVGREVKRYSPVVCNNIIILPYTLDAEKVKYSLINDLKNHKNEFEYLSQFETNLLNRAIIKEGVKAGNKVWYEFQQFKTDFPYSKEYIIYPDISSDVNFTLANNTLMDMTCFGIPSNSKTLLGILNSKLIRMFIETICAKARGGYLRLKSQYINNIPISSQFLENKNIEDKVKLILKTNSELTQILQKFSSYFSNQYKLEKLSGKLEKWYELAFTDFIKELNKSIKAAGGLPLTKKEEFEWIDLFEENKQKALSIKAEIDKTDKEIDRMVYELYGLTEEEVKIVESN